MCASPLAFCLWSMLRRDIIRKTHKASAKTIMKFRLCLLFCWAINYPVQGGPWSLVDQKEQNPECHFRINLVVERVSFRSIGWCINAWLKSGEETKLSCARGDWRIAGNCTCMRSSKISSDVFHDWSGLAQRWAAPSCTMHELLLPHPKALNIAESSDLTFSNFCDTRVSASHKHHLHSWYAPHTIK